MVGKLERLNAFMNSSVTIKERAGETIDEPAHKAVMFDANGDFAVADSAEKAVGVILSDTAGPVAVGETVTALIKDIGLLVVNEAVQKGDFITINDVGQGVEAKSGDFIFGRAFSSANAGECVQVQINPLGYVN